MSQPQGYPPAQPTYDQLGHGPMPPGASVPPGAFVPPPSPYDAPMPPAPKSPIVGYVAMGCGLAALLCAVGLILIMGAGAWEWYTQVLLAGSLLGIAGIVLGIIGAATKRGRAPAWTGFWTALGGAVIDGLPTAIAAVMMIAALFGFAAGAS